LHLNGTQQVLVYVDDVNVLGRSIDTIKKNTEVSKEIGREVYADKTQHMIMSPCQNAELNRHSSFESAEQFRYLRTTPTNQNSIQEEINSKMKSGNACYHSVQNLLSSSLLPKKYTD